MQHAPSIPAVVLAPAADGGARGWFAPETSTGITWVMAGPDQEYSARFSMEVPYSALRNAAQFEARRRVQASLPAVGSGGSHIAECKQNVVVARAAGSGKTSLLKCLSACKRSGDHAPHSREIRGGEALELLQAMTSGHGGCMSTVHAQAPTDTLSRLEFMASALAQGDRT